MAATLYSGPGKIYMGTTVLWPQDINGQIAATVEQTADDVANAMFGRVSSTQGDATVKVTITPFDNWGALGLLFPAFIGAKVGATAAALQIGTRPHNPSGGSDVPAKIWTPDGRLYTVLHAAITKHPDLHLGVSKPLFGPTEITGIAATGVALGAGNCLYTIVESAGADPGGQMTLADFERGEWFGVYGNAGTPAGFGTGGGATPIEAEDEWTISCEVKYSPLKVQQLTRAFKLDSVKYMVKVRPYGPTHTQIDNAIGINSGGRSLGARFASGTAYDLVLTGPGNKTITLKNADVVGAGFEFGGTKLGTGEIGFINGMTYAAGVPNSLIEFSA